jgi:hypothetical protein
MGNSLLRKFALSLAVFMTVIAMNLFFSLSAYAIDAAWDGDTIVINQKRFQKEAGNYPTIPAGSEVYVSKDATNRQAEVVYFAPGTDIGNANSADYIVFNFNPPSEYTSPRDQQPVTLVPQSGAQDRTFGSTGSSSDQATSCAITGIGWIVCPATRAIAAAMDKIFDLIKGFFIIDTITLDTNDPTYRIWEIVRGFANLCFIIAFLLIIYSQITSVGMSNYEIKKMIPKLIVAAILVNVSYYICAAAVDLSNILGNSVQQLFIDLRGQIVGPNTRSNTDVTSWQSMTTFILSGGTLAGAGIAAAGIAVASGASILSLGVILIPFLIGVIFSAIVALLILAARQAIIVVLITLAPLAFVAMLLPSTEKLFDRWRGLLTTMLVMFPLFAMVFGGAQLAGGLIIQTATSVQMMLIGMFVQVVPLAITPLLVRFSGSFLGKFASMIQNRQKGFVGMASGRLKEQDQRRRNRRIAEGYEQMAEGRGPLGMGMTKRWAARRESERHTREMDDKAYKGFSSVEAERHWKDRLYNAESEGSQTVFTPNGNRRRRLSSVRNAYASTYGAQASLDMLESYDKRQKEEAKAGESTFYGQYGRAHDGTNLNDAIRDASFMANLDNQAAGSALRETNRRTSALLEDVDGGREFRVRAAGIDTQFGEVRSLANAINARANDRSEGLRNIETMIDMRNPSAAHLHSLAIGHDVPELGLVNSQEIREVAIKKIAGGGNVQAINKLAEIIDLSDTSDPYLRTAFVDALKSNSAKPGHMSFSLLDNLGQGVPGGFGRQGVEAAVLNALNANKFDARGLLSNDPDTLRLLYEVLTTNPAARTPEVSSSLRNAIHQIAYYPEFKGQMGNRKAEITEIGRHVGFDFTSLPPELEW